MPELLVLAVLALVVVGPKDLPKLMRGVGQALGKIRMLADEFRVNFEQMARETEIEEMRKEIEELKKANPVNEVTDAIADTKAALEKTGAEVERDMGEATKPTS